MWARPGYTPEQPRQPQETGQRLATLPRGDAAGGRVYSPGLDGLRAVAIAMVYCFHDRQFLSHLVSWVVEAPVALLVNPLLEAAGLPAVSYRVEPLLTRPFLVNGWVGVQVFFVLSGFLITTLLLRERERFGRVDLRAFWVRRALRIWPLYYLVVAIGFGLIPRAAPAAWRSLYAAHLPAFLCFLGNWSMALGGPPLSDSISVLWSVCVEEQFYLFVPLLVALVGPGWREPAVAALIVSAVAGRYVMVASGFEGVALRYNSLANLDTLLAGVLLALIAHRRPALGRSAWPWRLLLVAGGVVIAAVPLCQGGPWRVALDQVLIWVWAVAFIVLAAAPGERWTAALRRPSVVWLGKISYGLYLFHEFAIGLVGWFGAWLPPFADSGLLLGLLGPAVTIALAAASYYGFERPFLRLKRGWTRVPSQPIDSSDQRRRVSGGANGRSAVIAAPAVIRPPRRPLVGIITLLAVLAVLAMGLAWAYTRPATVPHLRRRGPTIAEPRAHLPEWVRQHQRNVSRTMAGPVPLLFLGDSITVGWLGTSLASLDRDGPPGIWNVRYRSRRAENFGIDGDQVEHLLWRIRRGELSRIQPDVVVLLIGTNNIGLDPPEAIAEGIAAVVAEIHYRSPRSHVLLLGLLPRGLTTGHGQRPISDRPDSRIAEVNRLIAPLGDRAHVTYLDIGDRLLSPDGRIDRATQPDYLHLSVRGYSIWADAMEPTLVSLLGTPPDRAAH